MDKKEQEAAELIGKLNEKLSSLEKTEAEMKEITKSVDSIKDLSADDVKQLKELQSSYTKESADVAKAQKAQQEQLDALEAKLKKGGVSNPDRTKLQEALENDTEGVKDFLSGKKSTHIFDIKADMLNSTHTGDIVEQARIGGVFHTPDRNIHIRNFMNQTSFSTETIRYVQETAMTDNSATRAEGAAVANESDLKLEEKTAEAKIISSFFNVSKESLSDIGLLQNHIRTRGMGKIMLKEDAQILYGNGIGSNLEGITEVASAYTDELADANVNRYDVLAAGVIQARIDEYTANVCLVHPRDYDKIARTKDDDGRYLFPEAFISGAPISIYGCRVVMSTAMTEGDFLIGDWQMGGLLAIRDDVSIEVSRSHSTNFTKGMVTILIEERVALPIYRTDAFVYGDFATALAEGTA